MKKYTIIIIAIIVLAACNNYKTEVVKTKLPETAIKIIKPKYTMSMVNNKIDLNCGMPLTYGIEDTCHYHGKVYGFCSKECKDEFVRDPAGAIREK